MNFNEAIHPIHNTEKYNGTKVFNNLFNQKTSFKVDNKVRESELLNRIDILQEQLLSTKLENQKLKDYIEKLDIDCMFKEN